MSEAVFEMRVGGPDHELRVKAVRGDTTVSVLIGGFGVGEQAYGCRLTPEQLGDLRDFISFLRDVEPWEVE